MPIHLRPAAASATAATLRDVVVEPRGTRVPGPSLRLEREIEIASLLSEDEVGQRLRAEPWTQSGILSTARILRLGVVV